MKAKSKFEIKCKIKKHDDVLVTTGKYKGVVGKVQEVDREKGLVLVTGVNIRKRHTKNDGIITKSAPIQISNVSHFVNIDGKNVPSKVRIVEENGVRKRILVKTNKALEEYNYSKKSFEVKEEQAAPVKKTRTVKAKKTEKETGAEQ